MTALRQVVPLDSASSFRLERSLSSPSRPEPHFHPEIELVFIEQGHGKLYVGERIESYARGALVLLGPNVPHAWQAISKIATNKLIVVHLRPNFLECICNNLPELTPIRAMLKLAQNGLRFHPCESEKVKTAITLLMELPHLDSLEAVSHLIAIFTVLAGAPGQSIANSANLSADVNTSDRLRRVLDFIYQNFREPLSLAEIAQIAAMSPNAFCRYFRCSTGRNIFNLVAELRINYASKRLTATDDKIANIALESGFESVSSFNRQFLKFKSMQPYAFRKRSRNPNLSYALLSA